MTTQGDEKEAIRCSDVSLATSKSHVNLSKTLCLELDNFILKFEVTIKTRKKLTKQLHKNDISMKVLFKYSYLKRASLVAQLLKNLPAMQETPVRFLVQEDLL